MKKRILIYAGITILLTIIGIGLYLFPEPIDNEDNYIQRADTETRLLTEDIFDPEPTTRDLLLMSQLAYYSPEQPEIEPGTTVVELADYALDYINENSDKYDLILEIIENPKYSNWIIDNTTNQNDTNGLRAFSAATGDGHGIIAYGGTEGLYEGAFFIDMIDNINMAKAQPTDQQTAALEFLDEVIIMYDSVDVTGHSKGGNNAIFASFMLSSATAGSINNIVTFNAPGFNNEVILNFKNTDFLNNNVTQYRAPDDFVSAILETESIGDTIYAETRETGIGITHSLHTFMFDGDDIILTTEEQAWFVKLLQLIN